MRSVEVFIIMRRDYVIFYSENNIIDSADWRCFLIEMEGQAPHIHTKHTFFYNLTPMPRFCGIGVLHWINLMALLLWQAPFFLTNMI